MSELKIETPTENWTRFPNCILDNLSKFSGSEFLILGWMVRQNLGFRDNPNYSFSLSYIQLNTGLDRKTVVKALDGLMEKKSIIQKKDKGVNGSNQFQINWTEPKSVEKLHQWKNSTSGENPLISTQTSGKNPPLLVENFHPLKETIKRNNKEKETRDKAGALSAPHKKLNSKLAESILNQYWNFIKNFKKPTKSEYFSSIKAANELAEAGFTEKEVVAILQDIHKRAPEKLSLGMVTYFQRTKQKVELTKQGKKEDKITEQDVRDMMQDSTWTNLGIIPKIKFLKNAGMNYQDKSFYGLENKILANQARQIIGQLKARKEWDSQDNYIKSLLEYFTQNKEKASA